VSDKNNPDEDVNSLLKMIGGIKKTAETRPKVEEEPSFSQPSGEPSEEAGDFSALMKKLGMNQDGKSSPELPAPGQPGKKTPVPASEDTEIMSFDDLLEDPTETTSSGIGSADLFPSPQVEEDPVTPDSSEPDHPPGIRIAPAGEDSQPALNDKTLPEPASGPEQPYKAPEEKEPVIEIINEDPRPAFRKPTPVKKTVPVVPEPGADGAVLDEKIVSVDQISDLSGLILPKGATFKIDEIKVHGQSNAFEGTGTSTLPPEMAEIWKREFSSVGFKDLDIEDETGPEAGAIKAESKKFGFANLFKAIRSETENYDPRKHGPLVDLSFNPKPGIEEMEMYPVNEPYAYVRIIYDHSTHEYTYEVLEPVLTDPEKDLLKELKERLFDTLDINTKDLSKDDARKKLRETTDEIMQDYGIKLGPVPREKIFYNMHKDFLGNGLIDAIMHDKYIEDISCDGIHTPIFAFHSSYESMKSNIAYNNAEELDSFVTKLAQRAGKYISIAEPILDATMQDGSRIQMTLGQEVTAHGSTFTIRKFKDEPITPTDLIEWHTFAPLSIAYIWLAVENGKSAIFAGGTASGKTTALNAISLFIPPMAKIVSLEDTREVKLPHPNWIPSVTRDSFDTAGRGEINMYELLRAAMRQRPEYIIVGEVRGKECQTLFQAMCTGHVTYSTTHADSVASVVHRIENPPMDVPRNMLSALDFICVQVQARVGGKRIRRNKQIVEILDIDPRTNELITNEVFKWRSATDEHTYSGKSYLLEEIMEAKGWSENRMREELKRRQEVLEWMRIRKIRHYKDVAKILISYHRDPEAVIEKVRKDLYE